MRYIKFKGTILHSLKKAFFNTFGIEKILKLGGATSIQLGGNVVN